MKKALSVAALVVGLTGSALAADLPHYKAPPPPPLPPPPLWSGFYVGLNAGGTWGDNNNIYVASAPIFVNANPVLGLAPLFASTAALGGSGIFGSNSSGFIGGGQIGYNWQFYNSFVAGVEADIQGIAYSNNTRNFISAIPVPLDNTVVTVMSARKSVDYLGTVRGRLGWLFTPTLLVYGTGGLAYGGVTLNVAGFQSVVPAGPNFTTTGFTGGQFSDTRVGWTAGGGLEWMFMPNWSAKVEYLYYDLGSVRTSGGLTTSTSTPNFTPVPVGTLAWANATEIRTQFRGNIVRAGVNYHFNWGAAPIVAKY